MQLERACQQRDAAMRSRQQDLQRVLGAPDRRSSTAVSRWGLAAAAAAGVGPAASAAGEYCLDGGRSSDETGSEEGGASVFRTRRSWRQRSASGRAQAARLAVPPVATGGVASDVGSAPDVVGEPIELDASVQPRRSSRARRRIAAQATLRHGSALHPPAPGDALASDDGSTVLASSPLASVTPRARAACHAVHPEPRARGAPAEATLHKRPSCVQRSGTFMELDEGYRGAAALALNAAGDPILGARFGLTYGRIHETLELASRLSTTFSFEFGLSEVQV